MTSRVQKGGPIFRPVVKSRVRPDARQASVNLEGGSTPLSSPASMPPPATLPTRAVFSSFEGSSNSNVSTPTPSPSRLPAPGADVMPEVNLSHQTDSPNVSPIISSQVLLNPITASSSSSTPTAIPPPHRRNPLAYKETLQITTSILTPAHVLHHSDIENVPRPMPDSTITVKPPKTFTAKSVTHISPLNNEAGIETSSELTTSQNMKKTRNEASKSAIKRKKKVATSSDNEFSNDETTDISSKRRRRASSGTPRLRRSRAPSLPPFDSNADPGEEIDPTVVTMASLCSDTGQGRVSRKAAEILSNHAAWKAQNKEKRASMKALMELKKYGREPDEVDPNRDSSAPAEPEPLGSSAMGPSSASGSAVIDNTDGGFDYSEDLTMSRFNVQVRIGPNGETIIDEESLVVDRVEKEDTTNYTHVIESDHTKFVNSGTYGKRYRGSRWSAEETEMFYDALSQYGENYELIAYVLPGRDRKSCKNKFKAEDKKNPARINYCLSNNTPVDIVTLSRMTGKDFSGPVPEIRAPTPQPVVVQAPATDNGENSTPILDPARKRSRKKVVPEEGLVIIGQVDDFPPLPPSP